LLSTVANNGRIINVSSAAQAPVFPSELSTPSALTDDAVYAKSKLALTMWSRHLAASLGAAAPAIIAVNPASFLGSKMVQQAYGMTGGDLNKGADILVRAALSDEFSEASGLYFDNDIGQFSSPHSDALNPQKNADMVQAIERILTAIH